MARSVPSKPRFKRAKRGRPPKRRPSPEPPPLRRELARQRAFDTLYLMRSRGWSLKRAARESHSDPRTVKRYLGAVVSKTPSGRYRPKASDRLKRTLNVLTPKGVMSGEVRGSRDASLIAEHASAVEHYYLTGDASRVRAFRGKTVTVDGRPASLLTDLRALRRLQRAGEVSFEELYVYRG